MEEWRAVPGYEGLYEVSDQGRVRSKNRSHACLSRVGKPMVRRVRGKVLTPSFDDDGYKFVRLHKSSYGKHMRLARLVLTTFVREPVSGEEACHLNHDKADNALGNLVWGSRQENEDQKTAAGRRPPSERYGLLKPAHIRAIHSLRKKGLTLTQIGDRVGCHYSNVSLILRGKTWAR